MTKILLSIKPEHAENIIGGIKKYEFRRSKCKNNINRIVIYITSPVKKVVGEAEVVRIIEGTPSSVWEITKDKAGIDKDFFEKYFTGKEKAIAYQLGEVILYKSPLELSDFGISHAPQSFMYIR